MKTKIIQWANDRELLNPENAPKQFIKLSEEVGELANSILKDNKAEQSDAIGDIQIVLMILCEQLDIDYDGALYSAWNEIKDRKGVTKNGTFIKNN